MLQDYRIISHGIVHFQMTGQTALDFTRGVTLEFCAKYNELRGGSHWSKMYFFNDWKALIKQLVLRTGEGQREAPSTAFSACKAASR